MKDDARAYLNSFTAPFSPAGDAGLMASLPRDQAIQGLTIHFRTDPAVHAKYLPPGLEPSPDHPGEGLFLYAHHTATPVNEDCRRWHPDRVSTVEGLLGLVCQYKGETGTYYWYNFVDTDWDLAVLLLYGYPGKMARLSLTPSNPLHPYLDGLRSGAELNASVERLGNRVVTARVTLEAPCKVDDFPITDLLRAYGVRHIPNLDVEAGGRPLAYDLVVEDQSERQVGELWTGSGELEFHRAENEALHPLQPSEVLGAYYMHFGYRTAGLRVLHDYLTE